MKDESVKSGAILTDDRVEARIHRLPMRDGMFLTARTWENRADESPPYVLVILHGLGGHSDYYDYFAPLLAEGGPLVCAFDRRGHGLSDGVRGDIKGFNQDMVDLESVLTWLQNTYATKGIYLLGDSWGCLCALYYVSKSPDRIAGLILASPPVRLTITRRWIRPSLRLIGEILGNILRLRLNGKIGPPFPLDLASRDPRFFKKLSADRYANFKMSLRYGILALYFLWNAKRYAAKVRMPTILLQGDSDMLLNPSGATELFQVIPSKEKKLVIVGTAHHTLYYDPVTPDVVETILRWVSTTTVP